MTVIVPGKFPRRNRVLFDGSTLRPPPIMLLHLFGWGGRIFWCCCFFHWTRKLSSEDVDKLSLAKAATRWGKRACGRGLCMLRCHSYKYSAMGTWKGHMVVGASPLCNIMVMHFDTKNTIIVHQGDPNTKPGHLSNTFIFFICWRNNVLFSATISF